MLVFHGRGDALGSVLPRIFGTFEVRGAFVGRAVGAFAVGLGFGFAFAIGPLAGMACIGASARRRPNVRPFVPEAMIVNAKQLLPFLFIVNKTASFQQFEHRLRSQWDLLQGAANAPESILRAAVRIPWSRAAQLGGNAFRGNIAGQVPTCLVLPRVGEGVQEQAVQQRMHVVVHGRFASCGKASQHVVGVEVESLRISARQNDESVLGEGTKGSKLAAGARKGLETSSLSFASRKTSTANFCRSLSCALIQPPSHAVMSGGVNRGRRCVHDGSSRSHASPARTHLRLPLFTRSPSLPLL